MLKTQIRLEDTLVRIRDGGLSDMEQLGGGMMMMMNRFLQWALRETWVAVMREFCQENLNVFHT